MARGTSWHFGLEFTDQGPVAFGLTSYSQSSDSASPYFTDQSQRFSDENYRQLWFDETDIEANLLTNVEITITN
jgi:acyl-homoserine-lactone acylase